MKPSRNGTRNYWTTTPLVPGFASWSINPQRTLRSSPGCVYPAFHSPSLTPLQAQQENDDAKDTFDALNEQLITELPQLLDLRIPYFDPSFESMIRMQVKFAEEGYEKLGGVQRWVDWDESGRWS